MMRVTRLTVRDIVRPRVGAVVRTVGAATSGLRQLPGMLVVGTQRGGTTSLFRMLRQHPGFVGPIHRKGVHYFDAEYERGFDWYAGHFPLRATIARRSARLGDRVVVGEASPYYMAHPLAPARIGADLPDAKVVVLLRDPIERAYSAHAHERARGYESHDFEAAIELEPKRIAGEVDRIRADPTYQSHALRHQAYLFRGRYVEQLRAMEAHIERERILVLDSHRLFTEPHREFDRLLRHIGLSPWPGLQFEQHNARPRLPLEDSIQADLRARMAPYDADLADWLGWAPSWMSHGEV